MPKTPPSYTILTATKEKLDLRIDRFGLKNSYPLLIAAGSDFGSAQSAKHISSHRVDVIDNSNKLLELLRERSYERVVLDFNLVDVGFLKKLAQHYNGSLALYNVGVSNTTNIEEACRGMNIRYVRSATDGI